jgi:hypothetical protein
MPDTVEALVLDLLEWVGPGDRPYAELLEAWRGYLSIRRREEAPPETPVAFCVLAVHVSPVAECDDDDEQHVVLDRVDDPVITHAHTVPRTAP